MSIRLRHRGIVGDTTILTSRVPLYLVLGVVSVGSFILFQTIISSLDSKNKSSTVPSPRDDISPKLSEGDIKRLPYPPNAFPGARDVDTPYGASLHIYEWGPEDGNRVLLIHGISTPSIALGNLAHKLVDQGCRVMLFDLFGRGYSSAPDTDTYRHDSAFYASQVFFCIHSSPIIWSTFTLVGYSLGGGLATDFASYFPSLVSNLVLIAPSGLIRSGHVSWKNRLLYSTTGLVPEWLVEKVVARRLWTGPETARSVEPESDITIEDQEDQRCQLRSQAIYTSSHHSILKSNPNSTVGRVVDWQIQHHKGFVPAFISAIRYAPIHEQQHRWRILGDRMRKRQAGDNDASLFDNVHIVLGKSDPIVPADELVEDAKEALGESAVSIHVMDAGHEVAIEKAEDIAQLVGRILAE